MVTFTRSASGLKNAAAFFGVDRTVYVEGEGDDEHFWRAIFTTFYKGPLKFHFKSVGPRTTVLGYAEKICTGQNLNTVAILDSDYEGLKTSILPKSNILYSYGYSYENDLFSIKQMIRLISQLHGGVGLNRFRSIFRKIYNGSSEVNTLAKRDFLANLNGTYFLPKNGNTCRLNLINNSSGFVCRKSIESLRRDFKARKPLISTRIDKSIRIKMSEKPCHRWIYGHLWKAVFIRCISDELKKSSKTNINADGIERLAISNILDKGQSMFSKEQASMYFKLMALIQ